MEFWGIEVKPGQSVRCKPEDDHFVHLSQAALGDSRKGGDSALMFVTVDGQKLAIGTLSADKFPQIQFDLVFDKEFELTHTSKTSSVFFSGYRVYQPPEGDEEEDDMGFDSEEVEDEEEGKVIPEPKENGKPEGKGKEQKNQVNIDAAASKSKAVAEDKGKDKKDADDSESDDTDDSDSDDDDDIDMSEEDSSSDDDDESDEEETPKKPETGKKRPADLALKTPAASDKKAKIATPSGQKTGDKKGVHVATPHPAKQASKTSGNSEKFSKSGGSVVCKSCTKTFNSEMALQSHSKAKHGAK